MRLKRLATLAATSITSAALLSGIAGSSPAFATAPATNHMCVYGPAGFKYCLADSNPGNYTGGTIKQGPNAGVALPAGVAGFKSRINSGGAAVFGFPQIGGGNQYIVDKFGECLQLDSGPIGPHGLTNVVRWAPCAGDAAEQWFSSYDRTTHHYLISTDYPGGSSVNNLGTNECLSLDIVDNFALRLDPCHQAARNGSDTHNWYQEFATG